MATLITGTANEILLHIARAGIEQVTTEFYGGFDDRIGWHETYIVLAAVDGADHPRPIGFADAPLPKKVTAVSNSQTTGLWISVKDRLPELDTAVICSVPANKFRGARTRPMVWAANKRIGPPRPRWETPDGRAVMDQPTHWMVYPAPYYIPFQDKTHEQ